MKDCNLLEKKIPAAFSVHFHWLVGEYCSTLDIGGVVWQHCVHTTVHFPITETYKVCNVCCNKWCAFTTKKGLNMFIPRQFHWWNPPKISRFNSCALIQCVLVVMCYQLYIAMRIWKRVACLRAGYKDKVCKQVVSPVHKI